MTDEDILKCVGIITKGASSTSAHMTSTAALGSSSTTAVAHPVPDGNDRSPTTMESIMSDLLKRIERACSGQFPGDYDKSDLIRLLDEAGDKIMRQQSASSHAKALNKENILGGRITTEGEITVKVGTQEYDLLSNAGISGLPLEDLFVNFGVPGAFVVTDQAMQSYGGDIVVTFSVRKVDEG